MSSGPPDPRWNPSPSSTPPGWQPPLTESTGRIATSFRLLGKCWRLLLERPVLFVLPTLSAFAVVIAALVIFVSVLTQAGDALQPALEVYIALAATALSFTLITTFCNVGFLVMVQAHLRGEQPRVKDGLRAARERLGAIVVWSVLATLVGVALRGLAQIPGGEVAGRLLSFLGGLAWTLGTCFVVPVMVVEGGGALESMRGSVRTFRARWGETLAGDLTVGVAFAILIPPASMLVPIGLIAILFGAQIAGGLILAVAVVLVGTLLTAQSTLSQLFVLLLYRDTVQGAALPGPFSADDLRAGFRPRRQLLERLRSRRRST